MQASNSSDVRVELAVIDQFLIDGAKNLRGLFPDWVDVTAYASFMSSYVF